MKKLAIVVFKENIDRYRRAEFAFESWRFQQNRACLQYIELEERCCAHRVPSTLRFSDCKWQCKSVTLSRLSQRFYFMFPLKKNDPESLADEISKLQKPYEDGSAQAKFISTLLLTRALHFITRVPIQAPAIHRISLIKRQSRRTGGDSCCFIKTLTRYRFTSPATMKNNGKINKGRLL